MKKKRWIPITAAAIILAAVLFVPISISQYKDGGTKDYRALTYRIVKWGRYIDEGDSKYDKTGLYIFPNNLRSIDELWDMEAEKVEHKVVATITELSDVSAVIDDSDDMGRVGKLSFATDGLENIGAEVGSIVEVTYVGSVGESYPGQINAVSWKICNDLRYREYTDKWMDKLSAVRYDDKRESDLIITKIYSNCFFAESVVPMPMEFKLNGTLPDEWCVGDQVYVTYENYYYDEKSDREEADLLTIGESDFKVNPIMYDKPVIYLYPENETEVSVKLDLNGRLTCTYPSYSEDGWSVVASPDGTLTDENGQTYNYLYWEGEADMPCDLSSGFCIKGEDTAAFLEDALAKLGLTRREANEFIVYWLPLMQDEAYNIISFQTEAYTDAAHLDIEPAPDTLIRVFMAWQSADDYVEMKEQKLESSAREGFTVVEWGGTRIG